MAQGAPSIVLQEEPNGGSPCRFRHEYDPATGVCACPGCLLAAYMNSVVYGNQKIASSDVMEELPSASYRGGSSAGAPPPYLATISNRSPSVRDLKECPMFEAFEFCMYGRTCLLAHTPHAPSKLVAAPSSSLSDAVDCLFALGEVHSTSGLWDCHVCGFSGIGEYHVAKVGETYSYRYCPNCTVSCYLPELLNLVEKTIDAVGDDYQLYKDMIELYRAHAPDILKIPITYEAHRIATTLFAWSLVSPADALYATEALSRVCPEVERVVSLGAGTGFVEHVFNRVANRVAAPAAQAANLELCRETALHVTGRFQRDHTIPRSLNVATSLRSSYEGMVCPSFAGRGKRLAFFAFDEIIRPARYSVAVNYGEPHVLLSMDCSRSALLLCWPPFGSPEEEQSSMGFETLRHYTNQGGQAVIYVGDVSSTGDWRFHSFLAQHYALSGPAYTVRKEVRRWSPQDMGLVYAGCDTIGVYVRRQQQPTVVVGSSGTH